MATGIPHDPDRLHARRRPAAFGTRPDGTTVDLLDDGVWNFAGELGAQGLTA
ncbi:MAG: hypothetical protein ACLSCT_05610 [Oscillospiraceae bacterium]